MTVRCRRPATSEFVQLLTSQSAPIYVHAWLVMKLFKTNNMDTIKYCQHCLSFDMPSDLWEKRARTFACKFSEFSLNVPQLSLFVYLSGCLFIRSILSVLFYHYQAFGEIKIYNNYQVSVICRVVSTYCVARARQDVIKYQICTTLFAILMIQAAIRHIDDIGSQSRNREINNINKANHSQHSQNYTTYTRVYRIILTLSTYTRVYRIILTL